jgi:hypothetical protein
MKTMFIMLVMIGMACLSGCRCDLDIPGGHKAPHRPKAEACESCPSCGCCCDCSKDKNCGHKDCPHKDK